MKKKKPSIHLAGIGMLLNLIMYEDFSSYKFKYYIIKNKYEEKKNNLRYHKILEYQKRVVSAVRKKMNIDIDILENVIETNIFLNKQKKVVNYSSKSSIFIDNKDLVANHLFNYLKKILKEKKFHLLQKVLDYLELVKKKHLLTNLKNI